MSAVLAPTHEAAHAAFARDVLAGLSARRKCVPGVWLFDRRGCALAEQAARHDSAHPAHAEARLLDAAATEIGDLAGRGAEVVELGFGVDGPLPQLLAALDAPSLLPPLAIPDFERWSLPAGGRRLVFSARSALARFAPDGIVTLLQRAGRLAGPGALLLMGVDATRDPARLRALHDDRAGLAAAFDLNLLGRINRELGTDFDVGTFGHELRFDAHDGHVQTHLVSRSEQAVRLRGRVLRFAAGESIHTASVRAYGPLRLQALAQRAGWRQRRLWGEAGSRVALHLFEFGG